MSLKIEPCREIETKPYSECDCQIFDSKAEMRRSLQRLCYGDLYVIGRLWIESMKTVLVGSKLCLIPVVEAKPSPLTTPQKPPPMKYKDLPLYQSPHSDYYDSEEEKLKCVDYNKKILHTALLPHVTRFRREVQLKCRETKKSIQNNYKDICCFLCTKQNEFLCYARCPTYLLERRIALALGTTVGFLIGYKTGKGVTKPLVYSGIGALAVGSVCFPKETDEAFRCFCWQVGQLGMTLYNMFCKKNLSSKPKIPCEIDIPPPPPPKGKKEEQCPEKKK